MRGETVASRMSAPRHNECEHHVIAVMSGKNIPNGPHRGHREWTFSRTPSAQESVPESPGKEPGTAARVLHAGGWISIRFASDNETTSNERQNRDNSATDRARANPGGFESGGFPKCFR